MRPTTDHWLPLVKLVRIGTRRHVHVEDLYASYLGESRCSNDTTLCKICDVFEIIHNGWLEEVTGGRRVTRDEAMQFQTRPNNFKEPNLIYVSARTVVRGLSWHVQAWVLLESSTTRPLAI